LKFRILHIFNDEKFVDPTIKLFEEVIPGQSIYYIICSRNKELLYVKSLDVIKVDFDNEVDKNKLIVKINSSPENFVFLHSLDLHKQQLVSSISPGIIKVWFIWGFDLYGNWHLFKQNIFESRTRSSLNKDKIHKHKLIYNNFSYYLFKKRVYVKLICKKIYKILNDAYNTNFYKAVQLIDFAVPVIPTEYEMVKRINKNIQYAPFTYGCLEDLLGENFNKTVINQSNILVGNSADPSNNHLEIFYILSKLNLRDRKVYVPLSYGGNSAYINIIMQTGYDLLGSNFCPIIQYMSIEEYNKILLSCGSLIFNHIRQQGVGNIIALSYLGATIFLNSKSPVYSYYKSLGMSIFSIKHIESKINMRLDFEKNNINRSLLIDLYSRQAVHNKIITLLNLLKTPQSSIINSLK